MTRTPEEWWNPREYPYHYTGEVGQESYLVRLNGVDRSYLTKLLNHIKLVGHALRTPVHAIGVGSSADLAWPQYRDIDLLVCPQNPKIRTYFVLAVYTRLVEDKNFIVEKDSPKGSAPIPNTPYTPFKLFALPNLKGEMITRGKQFDMTFIGEGGGSFDEALAFHRSHNLAFTQLKI
jgi:hypothetical protein